LIEDVEQTTFLLTFNLDAEAAIAAALATGASGLQPYGLHASEAGQAGVESGLMVLRPIGPGDDPTSIPPGQYPLFDSKTANAGGTGGRLDLEDRELPRRPLVIAGGLNPSNVAGVIRRHTPFGVDVSSGVERSPGRKDHALIKAFVSAVRGSA
jgi:phosphoribosylanthranilate isomerase